MWTTACSHIVFVWSILVNLQEEFSAMTVIFIYNTVLLVKHTADLIIDHIKVTIETTIYLFNIKYMSI